MRKGVYRSLSEKDEFFHPRKTIKSIEELLSVLRQYQNDGYVFRGQSNALWKIRSSALRWWQDERCGKCCKINEYLYFLNAALQYAQKVEFPQLQPQCSINNKAAWFGDHEKMGYLQHYGYPTPLIDFTHDFYVALYMATRNAKNDVKHFSVYMLDPLTEFDNEIYAFEKLVVDNAETDDEFKYMTNFYKGGLGTPGSGWCQYSCVLIHKDGQLWCPHLAKERIVSQGGLFTYMNSDTLSLEEYFCRCKKWEENIKNGVREDPEIVALNMKPLVCLDVPCKFIGAVREIVMAEGYTDESMGLADNKRDVIAKACFEAFVKTMI